MTTKTAKKKPAKRKGTAKPNRTSQVTGKAPSKRLVKRRKENKVAGYFPNPAEVKRAHKTTREIKYCVYEATSATAAKKGEWTPIALCKTEKKAIDIANSLAANNRSHAYRVTKE